MKNDHTTDAKEIIEKNIHMVIATASPDGQPWISPVFFAYDNEYNLYWASERTSRHSALIRANKRIAIVIFHASNANMGDGDGVYIDAEAVELDDREEVERAWSVWDARCTKDKFRIKSIDEVTGDGVVRFYKATPRSVSILGDGEYVNGQYVDRRVEVDLA